jgi:hypothetical protein
MEEKIGINKCFSLYNISLFSFFLFPIAIIAQSPHPQLNVKLKNTNGCAPAQFIFEASIGNPEDYSTNDLIYYTWYFEEGEIINTQAFVSFIDTAALSIIERTYNLPGYYSLKLIAKDEYGFKDSLNCFDCIYVADTCSNIKGKIFLDLNGDCAKDEEENGAVHLLKLSSNTSSNIYYTFPRSEGDFNFNVPSDSYRLEIKYGSINCPSTGFYNINLSNTSSINNDFALKPGYDLTSPISGATFRPGFENFMLITLANIGSSDVSDGQLQFIYPSSLEIININPPADGIIGDTLNWNFNNLSARQNREFWITFYTPPMPTVNIGDILCFKTIVEPLTEDVFQNNNTIDRCLVAGAAYDPNNKIVTPSGIGEAGFIAKSTDWLHYRINFQNTGTDTAFKVMLLDTLDHATLDIGSLQLGGSSFPYSADLFGEGLLRFTFNNILLPDSNTNEPLSHGFVDYSIRLKEGLNHGTQIKNTAYIYFDFNPAIITNTTVNTIDTVISVPINVSNQNLINELIAIPNPAAENVSIRYAITEAKSLQIIMFNLMGQVMEKRVVSGSSGRLDFDISSYPAGMYYYGLIAEGEVIAVKKLVITK